MSDYLFFLNDLKQCLEVSSTEALSKEGRKKVCEYKASRTKKLALSPAFSAATRKKAGKPGDEATNKPGTCTYM